MGCNMRFVLLTLLSVLLASCAMPIRNGYDRTTGSYKNSSTTSSKKKVKKQRPSNAAQEDVASKALDSADKVAKTAAAEKAFGSDWETAAKPWLGTPYKYGGSTKKGVDCSGFVLNMYKEVRGKDMPHNAATMYDQGKKISRDDLREGDLVFFGSFWKIDHVGIYLNGDRFVHASSSRGVMISPMEDSYWKPRYQGARRY